MGCDIHFFIEKKNERGKWDFVGEVDIDRNYALFTILAGVRSRHNGFLTPISQPKGLPEDLSDGCRSAIYEEDHSDSYLTTKELCSYDWDSHDGAFRYFFDDVVADMVIKSRGELDSVRAVFNFDN